MPLLNPRFMRFPFADAGDKTVIPDTIQPSGDVSYQEGWTPDYELEVGVDPDAKPIDRQKHNSVFDDVTLNLKQYQMFGFPEWVDPAQNGGVPVEYDKFATVRYTDLNVYTSLVDNNIDLPTNPASWVQRTFQKDWISLGEFNLAGADQEWLNIPETDRVEIVVGQCSFDDASEISLQVGGVSYVVAPGSYKGQARREGAGSLQWDDFAELNTGQSAGETISVKIELRKFSNDVWQIWCATTTDSGTAQGNTSALGYVDIGEILQKIRIFGDAGGLFDNGVAELKYFGSPV